MAMNNTDEKYKVNGKTSWDLAVYLNRQNPLPLDGTSVYNSLEAAQKYASENVKAYPGQIISVVTETEVKVYKINNGKLEELGKCSLVTDQNPKTLATADNIGQIIYLTKDVKVTEGSGEVTYSSGPYIVSGAGTVSKIGTTSVSGDIAGDVNVLQGRVGTLESTVGKRGSGGDASTGLVKDVEDLKAKDTELANQINTFAGIATPTTNPGTPDGPVFYIATTAGSYSNFGNIEISKGESAILKWNNGIWTKNTFKPMTDFNSVFDANGKSLTEFESGIIYDVSAHNNNAVFKSIQALLSSSNLSTLIPTSVRHGGMSIRFIQSSDNKYVQYRLMAMSFSTDIDDWQGVENEPILNSKNIPTSGAVAKSLLDIDYEIGKEKTYTYGSDSYSNMILIASNRYPIYSSNPKVYNGIIIPIVEGVKYKIVNNYYSVATFSSYPIIEDSSNVLRINFIYNNEFTAEENEKYLLVSLDLSTSTTVSITVTESGLFRRVSSLESYIPDLYNRGFIITKAPLTYSNFIIDAYIPDYDANYLYYIDIFYWKHSEYGTRVRIKKENKSDHTISDLIYKTNLIVNNDDVQILDITSYNNTIAKLVINTKKLYDGYFFINEKIEFSDNVGIEHGLYLSNEEIRAIANSSGDKAEQAQGLAEQVYADNSKTTNKALLRKSINLFDGEFVNMMCDSTTGILAGATIYRTTKNPIPVTVGQTLRFTYTTSKGTRYQIGGYLQEYSDVEGTIPILRDTRLHDAIYKCTDENVKSIRVGFRADTLDVAVDVMEYMIYVEDVYANIYKQQASSVFPQYVPIGYLNELDPLKNTILGSLTGKKVICFGDSITAYGFYPEYAGLICGADIKNCGVGGTWLTHRVGNGYDLNTAWGKFSGDALADSIASGDFSAQVEAADYIYANAKIDVRRVASELVSTDWNNVNIVTFAFCTNDYNNTSHVEGTIDSMDSLTYRGAVNYIVNKIQTVYPHIKIIFICPPYRVYPYGHEHNMTDEEYKNSSYLTPGFEDSDTWKNAAEYTLKDIIKTVEDQAAINHCGCLNMYYNFGINKYTYLRYLADGTHLTYDGYREYGLRLAKFLMSAN